jgi:hypothetical protein
MVCNSGCVAGWRNKGVDEAGENRGKLPRVAAEFPLDDYSSGTAPEVSHHLSCFSVVKIAKS